EFGWVRPRCRLGKRLGRLECGRTMSGMEFWFGESNRREQVWEKIIWRVTRALSSDCQIQRFVYERHPGSCGLLCSFPSLLSLTLDSFGRPVILSSLS